MLLHIILNLFFFPLWRLAGLTMQVMYHFDFFFLIGARQGLSCNRSGCLHPSGLISNLAPGMAYHSFAYYFEFMAPGRAYHARYVSF